MIEPVKSSEHLIEIAGPSRLHGMPEVPARLDNGHMNGFQRRRVLILTPSLPYPPIWGFGIRVYQFVKLLARRHNVSLLTFAVPGEEEKVAALESLCASVHTVLPPGGAAGSKRAAQLKSLLSPVSYQRRSLTSPQMQEALDTLCQSERFDIIQIESSQMAGYRFDRRAVTVLDEHNIEYELLYRMFETDASPLRRLYNWMEYRKFRHEEIRSWHDADSCVMTSGREEEIVRRMAPSKPITVVPNAVDIEYFRASCEQANPETVVMTGLMHYRPNIDGALFFVRDVLPRILESRPNLVFTIVGAGPPDEIKRLAGPNVVVTDMVPDVRPYVRDSAVFVVPLRMGSGTRLKVLEGFAMERAMVSTSLGCEGIDVRHEEHLLIADEPADFAQSVLKLLDDRGLARKLGRNGRALVERRYSWETVVDHLESFHEQQIAKKQRIAA